MVEVPMLELPVVELLVLLEVDGNVDCDEVEPEALRLPEADALPVPLTLPVPVVELLDVLGTVTRKSLEPVLEDDEVPLCVPDWVDVDGLESDDDVDDEGRVDDDEDVELVEGDVVDVLVEGVVLELG
jgi:hypothetical protein